MTRRIGSYKHADLQDHYDTIIVGSGLGGLTTALLLAERGHKVLVLERHWVLGGFTHVFKRKGYEWDVGVHYVGEVHRTNSMLRQLFDYLTGAELQWASMGEVYDNIRFGDELFPFRAGTEAFREGLKEQFETRAAAKAIDTYVDTVRDAVVASRNFFVEKALGPVASFVAGGFLRRKYLNFARQTTWDVLRSMTDDPKLIGVLTGQYGDYGLPPRQSSFAMHATLVKHYFAGGSYPVGGSAEIADTMVPRIEAHGGELYTNAEVSELLFEGGKTVGVKMADGREIRANAVVSNAGVLNTFNRLLPASERKKVEFGGELANLKPSVAHASLYIGLDQTAEELDLPRANDWIYPAGGYDHDANIEAFMKDPDAPLPVAYVSFPSAKDPTFSKRHPGKATIEVVTLMPYEQVAKWSSSPWKKRGDDYDAFKEKVAQRLLAQLFHVHPQTKKAVDYYELSTPLSTAHFTAYQHGEIYGVTHDPKRFEQRFLKPKTPVAGLYLTGQDICTCGVGGALVSGFLTASTLTKENLVQKVLKG